MMMRPTTMRMRASLVTQFVLRRYVILFFNFGILKNHRVPQENLTKSSAAYLDQLKEKYKIGDDTRFPTMRIYSRDGRSWELNEVRLQLWAKRLVSVNYQIYKYY